MSLTSDQKKKARKSLAEMLGKLGFEATVETMDEDTLSVKTEDAGRIIGRKGKYLESLELILNRMMKKDEDNVDYVAMDVDGYRRHWQSRESRDESGGKSRGGRRGGNSGGRRNSGREDNSEQLSRMALDTAKEVKRWGETKEIGPFGARDRRAIHVALKEMHEVETESGPEVRKGMKMVIVRLADNAG